MVRSGFCCLQYRQSPESKVFGPVDVQGCGRLPAGHCQTSAECDTQSKSPKYQCERSPKAITGIVSGVLGLSGWVGRFLDLEALSSLDHVKGIADRNPAPAQGNAPSIPGKCHIGVLWTRTGAHSPKVQTTANIAKYIPEIAVYHLKGAL